LDKNAENSPGKMVLFYFGEKAPTKQPQTFPQCFVAETFPSYIKKEWSEFDMRDPLGELPGSQVFFQIIPTETPKRFE